MDFDAKYRRYIENREAAEARARARELFIAAGRPIPAWCDEGARGDIDPSAAIESDDELLTNIGAEVKP